MRRGSQPAVRHQSACWSWLSQPAVPVAASRDINGCPPAVEAGDADSDEHDLEHAFTSTTTYSMTNARCVSYLALLLLATGLVAASSGDRAREFGECVVRCQSQQCGQFEVLKPLSLRLTRWTCLDDCKYTCMHEITDRAVATGRAIQQYYGKWPFWRFAGMQEPASVVFSLFNLWSHFAGFKKVQRKLPESHPMRRFYLLWSVLSMNAWFWSAVFHTRGVLRSRVARSSD